MGMIVTSEDFLFGPPTSLKVDGIELGGSEDPAKLTIGVTRYAPDIDGAGGPVKGLSRINKIDAKLGVKLNELSLAKLQWALQNLSATAGTAATHPAGHSQVMAADSAAGASVIKFPGVALATSAESDDIVDTATDHGFTAGQRVKFESLTGGTGIVVGTVYFVIAANLAAKTLQVSLTLAGTAATWSADITAGVLIPAYTAGEFLKVGDSGETEVLAIDTVGTSGSGGTGLTFTTPLLLAHDSGDAILEVDDAGTTILRQRTGIISASQHIDVVMQAVGPDGKAKLVTLFDCLNVDDVAMTFGTTETAGTPVTFEAYYDGADPTLAPYAIETLTA